MNDDKWRPEGAPEIRRDFETGAQAANANQEQAKTLSPAQQECERHRQQKLAELLGQKNQLAEENPHQIAEKSELERLLSERSRPKPALNCNMIGGDRQAVDSAMNQERENKIRHLVERLAPMQDKARDDFNMNADTYQLDKAKTEQGLERD